MKKRILFVDDEPKILEGLTRMLRAMRNEWDVRCATGGAEALELMAQEPFDLVVSDMRMPLMSGLEFLTEVRARHPHVVRVILSGHADELLIMRSVGVTHQYLSKPCDAETLRSTIERAIGLRALLADEKIKLLVSGMTALPSLPTLYEEMVRELQSADASIRRIGEIIARDLGMTARILQLVNSAFFGIRRRVSNPVDAAAYLGLETLQSLVLLVNAFSKYDGCGVPGCSMDRIWSHSITTGVLARRIAEGEHASKGMADESFTAGLLHDLGKLVLASNLPGQYAKVLARSAGNGAMLCDHEIEAFGFTHAEVGAYLLGLWGLPDSIIEAIAFHHRPGDCADMVFSPLSAVHAADALVSEFEAACRSSSLQAQLDLDYIARIGKAERLEEWRRWCREAAQPEEGA